MWDEYWQWGANSCQMLLYVGFSGFGARLSFMDTVADTWEKNLDVPGFFQAPGISPSGDFVAYARSSSGIESQISVRAVTADSSYVQDVEHSGLVELGWSPIEDGIAVMSPWEDSATFAGPIGLIDAEPGSSEQLIEGQAMAFFWAPTGQHLAYLTRAGEVSGRGKQQSPFLLNLWVVNVETRSRELLTTFQPTPTSPLTLPTFGENGNPQIVVVTLDGITTRIATGDTPFWNQR
jgi:Tol biopolymer transport system component